MRTKKSPSLTPYSSMLLVSSSTLPKYGQSWPRGTHGQPRRDKHSRHGANHPTLTRIDQLLRGSRVSVFCFNAPLECSNRRGGLHLYRVLFLAQCLDINLHVCGEQSTKISVWKVTRFQLVEACHLLYLASIQACVGFILSAIGGREILVTATARGMVIIVFRVAPPFPVISPTGVHEILHKLLELGCLPAGTA